MRSRLSLALPVIASALALGGCGVDLPGGTQNVDLPGEKDPDILAGAQIFAQRCEACHTLNVIGAQGSSFRVNDREYKDGPNFNQRDITYDQILYAIRNGGFSSGPMPQNIVVGKEAEMVACFVAKYSGSEVARSQTPGLQPPTDTQGGGEEATSKAPEETGANCPK